MRKAIFTIVSNNYLHYARTLLESVAIHHPECERFCVLVDVDPSIALSFPDEFAIVRLEELDLPDFRKFTFRYSILELNTAVKPWAFALLMSRGYDQIVYLDPDIRLYAPMTTMFDRLSEKADVVLTPHLLAPMTDTKRPSELDIRKAGTYNLGFCALANRGDASLFIAWWQSKLVDRCLIDFEAGLFVDQSWIDLVPGLFAKVFILRHAGYNVAYWNIAQRQIARNGDQWTVDEEPLVFFHFSGLDPVDPTAFSKHQNRFTTETLGAAQALVADYADCVRAHGADAYRALPYGFGFFQDAQIAIPDFFRESYRNDAGLQRLMGADPYSQSSLLTELIPARRAGQLAMTRAMWALWTTRSELRRTFPLTDNASVAAYWRWLLDDARDLLPASIARTHALIRASMPETKANPHAWLVPRGWYAGEQNVAEAGIWVMPEAALPLFVQGAGELVVEGYYEAECVERQTGTRGAHLSAFLDGNVLFDVILDESGPFVARSDLPAHAPLGVAELVFRCSGHFVPHAIGLGDDFRELAWRARRIAIGTQTLLDARVQPPIGEIDGIAQVEGVDLVGYLKAESGVGESVRSFAGACRAVGLGYTACDVGYQSVNRQNDASLGDSPTPGPRFGVNVIHVNADQTETTWAALPPLYRAARINVGYWHWEQSELPMRYLPSFEYLTEIWVPSGFVRDAVASISPIPVFKVPHAIEISIPATRNRAAFDLPEDHFCVLVMYDFASSAYRKNPLAAIEAFRLACIMNPDAMLVIKTINADLDRDAHREMLDAIADLPRVRCIDGYLGRSEMHALEHACDCLVSLHRAEGYGLGLAEMMYLGKPVIATGWSGNMEFMTSANSFPIDYELKPLEHRAGPYETGQPWAEADVEQAAHVLARLIEDHDLGRRIGQRASAHMRQYFGPARIGALYRRRLGLLSMRRSP